MHFCKNAFLFKINDWWIRKYPEKKVLKGKERGANNSRPYSAGLSVFHVFRRARIVAITVLVLNAPVSAMYDQLALLIAGNFTGDVNSLGFRWCDRR